MNESACTVPEPSDEEIALAAYRLWLHEGCPHGRDRDHWLKARQQLIDAKTKEISRDCRGKSSHPFR